jgi:hypothetical protein
MARFGVKGDFNGTLRGQGMDETTVRMAPGVEFGLLSWLPRGVLFNFQWSGDPTVPDLGIKVSDFRILADQYTETWYDPRWPTAPGKSANGMLVVGFSVNAERLRIEGIEDPSFPPFQGDEEMGHFSLLFGIMTACYREFPIPMVNRGSVSIRDVIIRNAWAGVWTSLCADYTLGGKPGHGVDIADTYLAAELAGSKINISHSRLFGRGVGLFAAAPFELRASHNHMNGAFVRCHLMDRWYCWDYLEITHNQITQILPPLPNRVWYAGVEIWPTYSLVNPQVTLVANNEITGIPSMPPDQIVPGSPCNPWAGVYTGNIGVLPHTAVFQIADNQITSGSDDCRAVVLGGGDGILRSNRLKGQPMHFGIGMGDGWGWNIRDNNVNQLNACPDIYLSGLSYDNTVVGNRFTTVWDFGVNNTIIGDNPNDCAKPPGIMKKWLELEEALEKDRLLADPFMEWMGWR